MFKLDNAFLEELGLGSLPAIEKNKMLAHIYETLEMRVGMRLAEQMSNEQLDEFESFINRQDEAGALKWLESNFPNYKQVVAEELERLKGEVRQVAPQIVEQARQAGANAPVQSPAQSQPAAVPQNPQNSLPPTQQQPGNNPNWQASNPQSQASQGWQPSQQPPAPQQQANPQQSSPPPMPSQQPPMYQQPPEQPQRPPAAPPYQPPQ